MHKFRSQFIALVVLVGILGLSVWVLGVEAVVFAATPVPTVTPDVSVRPSSSPEKPVLFRQALFGPYEKDTQQAWGNVQHRRLTDREVLHLTPNFKAKPGSKLEIVLTQSGTPAKKDIASATKLADLRALEGTQEYDLPKDQDFAAVVIYARDIDAVFAIARLGPKPACSEVPARGKLAYMKVAEAPTTCLAIDSVKDLNLTNSPLKDFDIESYRLVVEGLVDNPLSLTYQDLKRYPSTSEVALLICSGVFADTAEWTGVQLSVLLDEAGVRPDYKAIRLEAVDGYWSVLERGEFKAEDVILAYQVNGEQLPPEHGYPLRAVVKGDLGSRWVKSLGSIKVLAK